MAAPSAFRILAPFALGYFCASVFRSIIAVLAPDLMRDMGIDAASLGLLASGFFIGAVAFQIPVGILLDRFGPRLTNVGFLVVVAAGAALFSQADDVITLTFARAMIGAGMASCMASSFKAFVLWLPPVRLPLFNGLILAAGGLGMVGGTWPVQMSLEFTDWRGVHLTFAVVVLAAAIIVFLAIPRHQAAAAGEGLGAQLKGLGQALNSFAFWRVAPAVTSIGVFGGMQGLWAGPWMRDIAGFDRTEVSVGLMVTAIAMVISFPATGYAAARLNRIGISTMSFALSCLGISICVQIVLLLQWTGAVFVTWALFGFFGTVMVLSYATLNQQFPPAVVGRVNTSLTLIWMSVAFATQTGVGAILDRFPANGGGYAAEGYQIAFAILIALQVASLIWYFVSGLIWKTPPPNLDGTAH